MWIVLGLVFTLLDYSRNGTYHISIWVFMGLLFLYFYKVIKTNYTLLSSDMGDIYIIQDKNHDKIFQEIETRRDKALDDEDEEELYNLENFQMFYSKVEPLILQEEHNTIYKIDIKQDGPATSLSYIGGQGVGVDDLTYPKYGDNFMEHLCSFDTKDFPHLTQEYPDIRVISVYISSFEENYAYEIETEETKVLLLTQADIDNKKLTIDVPVTMDAKAMKVTAYKIPKDLLSRSILDYPKESWQHKLYIYWHNFSYIGGAPTWIQDGYGTSSDGFIGQLDEFLFSCKKNRGGSCANFGGGVMYIFDDFAFWECG